MRATPETPGVIDPGHLYEQTEAQRRLRLGDTSWKRLLKAGLPVVRHGHRSYVLGSDLIDVLMSRRDAAGATA